MLLTISTTHEPATDLGYLLHKNPERAHTTDLPFGRAHIVFEEATPQRCTAALIVEVDPVGLVRNRKGPKGSGASLAQYVNDRPYAASSFLSVALARMLGTALSGRSRERPGLADAAIAVAVRLPVVPCRGGEPILRRLFEPLGYRVDAAAIPLDPTFPDWGDSRYLDVTLTIDARLRDVLEHLFVLLPVLDDDKHYWVGAEEVDKLVRRGGDWLGAHPEHELIARRYLRHDRRLTLDALARLLVDEPADEDGDAGATHDAEEQEVVEKTISLNEQRLAAVIEQLRTSGARRVVDLGCGGGKLVHRILRETTAEKVLGVDVSHRALEGAAKRLHLDTMAPRLRERVDLVQGALTYRDRRLEGFDAATVVEVVEHLDPGRGRCSSTPGRRRSSSPRPTSSTTRSSRRCPPGRSATRTTASSGREPSSPSGATGSRARTGTRSSGPASAPRTPTAARPLRWRCSGDEAHRARAVARGPRRRVGLGQVDVRGPPLPAHRGPVLGLLPWIGQR